MSEKEMPAAEAVVVERDDERGHYEFAFHVLPTVAEGEVAGVFESIKNHITHAGGEITIEEAPQRIDLAYEIVKSIEGKNRKFHSAYFGWVRFTNESAPIAGLTHELESMSQILRSILIKLSRVEEEHPFFYHESMAAQKQVTTVSEDEVSKDDDDTDTETDGIEVAPDTDTTDTEDESADAVTK